MEIYLVGGSVRDKLLGREVKDRDWVVIGATADQMIADGYIQVGKDFPVFHHPETNEEYSLARAERNSISSMPVSLEEDLSRRDLTINAMAMDNQGNIIDPFGGEVDLKNRILRHVSGSFAEDPVRILRVARFAARYHSLGFRVCRETVDFMAEVVASGGLDALVPDRVWKEVVRALNEPHPEVFVSVLRDCGALRVIMPELDVLFGIPQPEAHHPEIDTGIHTLMVMHQAIRIGCSTEGVFAAMLHDLGKGATPVHLLPSHCGHEEAGVPLIKVLSKRIGAPNSFVELAIKVSELHLTCHRAFELRAKTILRLFLKLDAFRKPKKLNEFLLACEADARGRLGLEDTQYPQASYLLNLFKGLSTVVTADMTQERYPGKRYGEEVYNRRISKIKQLMQEHSLSNKQHVERH